MSRKIEMVHTLQALANDYLFEIDVFIVGYRNAANQSSPRPEALAASRSGRRRAEPSQNIIAEFWPLLLRLAWNVLSPRTNDPGRFHTEYVIYISNVYGKSAIHSCSHQASSYVYSSYLTAELRTAPRHRANAHANDGADPDKNQ